MDKSRSLGPHWPIRPALQAKEDILFQNMAAFLRKDSSLLPVSTHSCLPTPKDTKQKGKLQSIYNASTIFYLEYKLEINDNYWTFQWSASNRVNKSSMRQRLNLIGRRQRKEREEAGGRTKCFLEGEKNSSKIREALFHTGSPSGGSKQMQTTQNGGSALSSRSGLNICTCSLEATRQYQQTQAHPLPPSDTAASRNYLGAPSKSSFQG